MKAIRIIPRLDVKGPNLVKGVHLEGLRVLGKPEDFALKYYAEGADELIYVDVVASLYGRDNLLDIVRRTAQKVFIPLTAGGGLRSVDDIRDVLRAGADKVAINTGAVNNPLLIKEGAKAFGSQCIVVSIEAKMRAPGKYEALTDNGREKSGRDVYAWAKEAVDLGAGEILITCIDREGTGRGYDLDLTRTIAESVPIPVIACGGCGKLDHLLEVVQVGKADAVCAASLFHYDHLKSLESAEQYREEGNIEFLRQRRGGIQYLGSRMQPADIPTAKEFLEAAGVQCRSLDPGSPQRGDSVSGATPSQKHCEVR
jgi:cyclase